MTRTERAALRAQRLKEELAATNRQLAQLQAKHRAVERAERHKRRVHVGLLAEQAGLLVWEDATLARLFALLHPLTQVPDPVAVLDALLADPECAVLETGAPGTAPVRPSQDPTPEIGALDGRTHAAHGVSPAC